MTLDNVLSATFGFGVGVLATVAAAIFHARSLIKKNKRRSEDFYKEMDKIKDTLKRANSVQDRFNKVKDITKEQLDLQMQTEMPQKNSLDGKYKNQLSRRIKDLEEEKKTILSSILDDGFDPEITALNSESKMETMKLSTFLNKESLEDSKQKAAKPKLRLIKPEEEKDETL